MSEYQYYEFRAVDCPLSAADQRALRQISARATITSTSFVNTYNWGDFKGDPDRLMERYFDLFLYLANWGSRRLSVRLPARIVEAIGPVPNFAELDGVKLRRKGEHIILDLWRDELETEDWRDGEEWLEELAPLRSAALEGDPSLFYLAWLLAVDGGEIAEDALEPAIGMGPLSPALEAFAGFFGMDRNLIEATAGTRDADKSAPPDFAERYIRAMPDEEKVQLLLRLHAGEDLHLGGVLRQQVRAASAPAPAIKWERRVSDLRAFAAQIAAKQARQAEAKAAAENRRKEWKEAEERDRRLETLAQRGENVWRDVEREIEHRNNQGYDRAIALLSDLRLLAERQSSPMEFARRVAAIRRRHAQKWRFLERLSVARVD
jgi:hypothetical protein